MAGLLGWFDRADPAGGDGSAPVLSVMAGAAGLPHETRTRLALAAESVHGDETIVAAIAGRPQWTDDGLAALAAGKGHAAALAEAWRRHDVGAFDLLAGGYALAVADLRAGRLVAGIDRMGIGRLYYATPADGGIVLGPTADAVAAHPAVTATPSPQGIYDYLFFFMSPAPGTIYADQRKLLAAEYLVFENGAVRTGFHWRMPYRERTAEAAPALEARLRETLDAAVVSALDRAGDGPVGAFLSGGLDSSTVAGLIERARPGVATCFTIGFDVAGYDEMPFAEISARHFGCRHHPHYMTTDDLMDAVARIAVAYDEPYGNSSAVPTYICAKVAAETGVATMIAGDGGDELFAGNDRYVADAIYRRYARLPAAARKLLIEPAALGLGAALDTPLFRRARNFIRYANTPVAERIFARNLYGADAAGEVFEPEFLAEVDPVGPIRAVRDIVARTGEAGDVQRMMHLDLQRTLADNDLLKVGRMCAAAGVGVLYPFLDERVVELAAGIPEDVLLPGGQLRGFYKSAFGGFLPRETIEKQKHGFGIPTMAWSREVPALSELIREKLDRFAGRGIFRRSYLDAMIASILDDSPPTSRDAQLVSSAWDVMMLEMWYEHHAEPAAVRPAEAARPAAPPREPVAAGEGAQP